MEGFAFFTEAIFLALYLYGERRLSRRALFLCTIPLTVSSALSAAFVISANGWMNSPAGFQITNGAVQNIRPLLAFANRAWFHEAVHGTLAAYVATGFAMAGIYATALLRRYNSAPAKKALLLSLTVAALSLPFMLASGDWAARFVAEHQKAKLAAMEAHFHTRAGAPLIIGGWPDPATGTVSYAIKVPKLLSVLAHGDPDSTVEGLDAFPAGDIPDARFVHPFFDLMVASFFIMTAASARFWWLRWRKKQVPRDCGTLLLIIAAAPFGFLALEGGWLVTEFGRQPWVVQGYLRTAQGVTPHGGVLVLFATFLLLYLALTVGILRLLLRNKKVQAAVDGEVPHG